MSKRNKILLVVLVVVIIGAVIAWPKKAKAYDSNPGKSSDTSDAGKGGTSTPAPTPKNPLPTIPPKSKFPLGVGSRGDEVKRLQKIINYTISKKKLNMTPLVEDGVFGNKTLTALKYWLPTRNEVDENLYNLLSYNYTAGYGIGEKNPAIKSNNSSVASTPYGALTNLLFG